FRSGHRMRTVAVVVVVTAVTSAVAFRPEWGGTGKFWGSLLGMYAALGGFAIYRMWDEGIVKDVFKFKGGDFAIGGFSALLLLAGSWIGRAVVTPEGSEEQAWLAYVYLMVGDPQTLAKSLWLTAALLLVAALEEVVWRAMVLDELMQRLGERR